MKEQAKFTHSPLGKALEKQIKAFEYQEKKKKEKQLKIKEKNRLSLMHLSQKRSWYWK